jgi:hypothetical protein
MRQGGRRLAVYQKKRKIELIMSDGCGYREEVTVTEK